MKISFWLLFTSVILFGCTAKVDSEKKKNDEKIMVFFLAGQSNMDGRARAYKLTGEDRSRLKKAQQNVILYYNHNDGVPLQVTKANDYIKNKFKTDSVFGPELFFGISLSEKYPDRKIILIKRSKGGMSLYGAWNPEWDEKKAELMHEENEPKLYSDFVNYARSVLKNYKSSDYELCGMLWVQGETDSNKKYGTEPALNYEKNLKKLIQSVRKDFSAPQLPFIMFQVGNEIVTEAMQKTANEDPNVSLIPQNYDKDSKDYFVKNPPPLGHYKYSSMKKIGNLFFTYYQEKYADKSK